jgi:hypothetical protein
MIPSPIQKVGIHVNHQRIESPKLAVFGIFCNTKITKGRMPPTRKWTKRVMIWATVSPVNTNEVM